MKTEVSWTIDDAVYTIANVPYEDHLREKHFDLDVSIRLTMVRDLMYKKELPNEIDYELVANFNI